METWIAAAVVGVCAAGVGLSRPPLVERHAALQAKSDVYPLPSPQQTVVLSLGYRSALADVLYASVLVSYGQHIQERRRFEFVGEYLDTIATLDPKFAEPYRYADTFLVLQGKAPGVEDYFRARKIFERGMQELPHDGYLWLTAGQFIAYIAPPHLGSTELFRQWRLDGARVLARACELIGTSDNLPYQCITAATLFSSAGEQEASERFLERVLAVSDDPEIRSMALGYLEKRLTEGARARIEGRFKRLEQARQADLPYVSKDRFLVLGPPLDAAASAGRCPEGAAELTADTEPSAAPSRVCTTDWHRFAAADRAEP